MSHPQPRGRLFRKYVVVLLVLVGGVLMVSSLVELYFSYRQTRLALARFEHEKAVSAAGKIEEFFKHIERQVRGTTEAVFEKPTEALEQREIDYLRLLRNISAITEIGHLDATGKEQLRVSRLTLDQVGSQQSYSRDPRFLETRSGKTYFSPVHFRNESEPYLTIAVPSDENAADVTTAEVNLTAIWDLVSQLTLGRTGYAYVVDAGGHLVAHPDISLVLQKRDLSGLAQVQSARTGRSTASDYEGAAMITTGLQGGQVLTTYAPIATLGWLVFVEQSLDEAFAPLQAAMIRSVVIFVMGLGLSILASVVLARRMVAPIQALRAGAARIGAGDLSHRLQMGTGDELQLLGEEFNRTAAQLQESYANLEKKVDERTKDLTEALDQQTAIAEILRVISSSPTEIHPVLNAVAEHATRLCSAHDAVLFRVDGPTLRLVAHYGPIPYGRVGEFTLPVAGTVTGQAVLERREMHIADVQAAAREFPEGSASARQFGYRTALSIPLLREGVAIGAITLRRLEVQPFGEKQIGLLRTLADQAVIAIENVRLFDELQARTQALTRSVGQLTALGEVGQAVSSTLDHERVLTTIVSRAVELSGTDGGIIYEYDEAAEVFHVRAAHHTDPEHLEALAATPLRLGEGALGRAAVSRTPVEVEDILAEGAWVAAQVRHILARLGYRSLLAVPLLREDRILGGLAVWRRESGRFAADVVSLLQTFATQSALAMQNAKLFGEIEDKGRQLEVVSRHKSEFLANMSHELRTPLNAIIGYSEMLQEEAEDLGTEALVPDLKKIHAAGRHLLDLINAVLDLSKIEAGKMGLYVETFEVPEMVRDIAAVIQPLARQEVEPARGALWRGHRAHADRPHQAPSSALQSSVQRL